MATKDETKAKNALIQSDAYPMSLGELMHLYLDKELEINLELYRLCRWTAADKSALVESVLLGLPLPPLTVMLRDDGVWEVLGGLTQLAALFEFTGILRDNELPPLRLHASRLLPEFEGKVWKNEEAPQTAFSIEQRFAFKRASVDVKIIKSPLPFYELFYRLNHGASGYNTQEIRNCMLISIDKSFYQWLSIMADYPAFNNCLLMTDRQKAEKYDMELALMFFVCKNTEAIKSGDCEEWLSHEMIRLCDQAYFDREKEEKIFKSTFDLLSAALAEDSFRSNSFR